MACRQQTSIFYDLLKVINYKEQYFMDEGLRKFKIIIIGKQMVGKSTLLIRYVKQQFNLLQKATVGIDYLFKKVMCDGNTFNLQLWDSAGQERYRTIVYNYFNLSKAACVVFDITNEESLSEAKSWFQQIVLRCGNDIPKILIANKSDLLDPLALKQSLKKIQPQINELKQEYDCQFFVVSALTGWNINNAFDYLVRRLSLKFKNQNSNQNPTGFQLAPAKVQSSVVVGRNVTKQTCC